MSAQLSPIEAHECTIGSIFSDSYAFEVPPYQRPYAWEEEQTHALLDDLIDAMDNKEVSGGVYFLGSIVVIKSPNDSQSKVVDGQQRLTTFTILLSALRDLTTDQERKIDRSRYVFQKANPDLGTQERTRLLLRQQDQPFFLKHIQKPGATASLPDPETLNESQQRIAENARYIRSRTENLDEDRRNSLVAFILQSCYIVVVAVPTAAAARRIFTVLNARGLDLAPTDILKADFLGRAGSTREGELAKRWEAVELAVGRDKMVELFGHIRMIYERDKPRLALEAAFPKSVAPFLGDSDKFISEVLEPIGDSAVLLSENDLVIAQLGLHASKAVRSLDRIDNKDWMPPVLLRLWKRKPGDGPAIQDFLLRLERLAYFMFVCRYGINDRIARFAMVMNEIDPKPGSEEPAHGLELTTDEQAQFIEALEGPLYPKSRVCKPVLQRLDEALSAGGATYDNLVSIEHVLPQTVAEGSEWFDLFPDQSIRNYWTHRLANLVFLTKRINIRSSNWDFEKKKKEYFVSKDGTSPFPLTQSVLQAGKWSIEHLIDRQAELIAKLNEVWKLESKTELAGLNAADVNEADTARQTGRELNEKWGIGGQHTLYRKDGTWYHRLERFPGALCDKNGYILFDTQRDLETCPGISIGKEKNWLSVPTGIASLPKYKRVEP